MKILCINPPSIPSYYNSGYRIPLFQVAEYLRTSLDNITVEAIDCALLNYTWRDICSLLVNDFDLIIVLNDYDSVDLLSRFLKYVRQISPNTKTMTFGRLSMREQGMFKRLGFDAIQISGDYETAAMNYVNHLLMKDNDLQGLLVKNGDEYKYGGEGVFLQVSDIVLPNPLEMNHSDINRLYKNDLNKFCGIPNRTELVVPLSRGCGIKCSFCDVHRFQGSCERRLPVNRTLDYIKMSFSTYDFDYISFFASRFTQDKEWVEEFCNKLIKEKRLYPWKCVTTIDDLDSELIRLMGESGCVRISVGIETFDSNIQNSLHQTKNKTVDVVQNIILECKNNSIELNCFLMIGMPSSTRDGDIRTVELLKSFGARVRPVIYTPYDDITETMDADHIQDFNRQLYLTNPYDQDSKLQVYKCIYSIENDNPSPIHERI